MVLIVSIATLNIYIGFVLGTYTKLRQRGVERPVGFALLLPFVLPLLHAELALSYLFRDTAFALQLGIRGITNYPLSVSYAAETLSLKHQEQDPFLERLRMVHYVYRSLLQERVYHPF